MGALEPFSNLSQDHLISIFSKLPCDGLPSIFPTCKSFYSEALSVYSNSLSDFWKKIITLEATDQDLSLAAFRLEHKPENQSYIKFFKNIYASQTVSLQANFCKRLLQHINKNKNQEFYSFTTHLFNQHSEIFKLTALDYMNLSLMKPTGLKWSRVRKEGLIPKRFTHFNMVEIPSKLISTITIHPEQKFATNELVAVIAKTDHLRVSLYFGVVQKYKDEIYTIYLKYDDNWGRAELKSSLEIGKLSSRSRKPSFCHSS